MGVESFVYLLLSGDPFADYRSQFALFIKALLGIVCLVSLTVTVYDVIQGERESAQKMFKWVVISVLGFILVEIIENL